LSGEVLEFYVVAIGSHGICRHDLNFESIPSLNLTLKMDGWKMNFLLGRPISRGYVGFGEGNLIPLRP